MKVACLLRGALMFLTMFSGAKKKEHSHHSVPQPSRTQELEAQMKADGPLTLSVGEVEKQTQDQQQRHQQQRGSGSVHGGTAWHQHALAASVALAHRAL